LDVDDAIRVRVGQRTNQHALDGGKDRGAGPDAQAEGDDERHGVSDVLS
jgi:hypothetical protein